MSLVCIYRLVPQCLNVLQRFCELTFIKEE